MPDEVSPKVFVYTFGLTFQLLAILGYYRTCSESRRKESFRSFIFMPEFERQSILDTTTPLNVGIKETA